MIPNIFKYTGLETGRLSLAVTIGNTIHSFSLDNPDEQQVFISKPDQVERWLECGLWTITEVLDDDPVIATFEGVR